MKMKDILLEWKRYVEKDILQEGGNATAYTRDENGETVPVIWKGLPAQAKPIVFDENVSRTQFVNDVKDAIRIIDQEFESLTGESLYNPDIRDEMLNSGFTFMGSSEFLFASPEVISDTEYTQYKKKTGDIDLLVPQEKISGVFNLLNNLRMTRLSDRIFFVGHNKLTEAQMKGEQTNAIFEYETPEKSFLFQIDFVFVPFDEIGRPKAEEKFLRGSSWEDIKMGFKGIGHKHLLGALAMKVRTIPYGSAVIVTPTSTPEKQRFQTSFPDIKEFRIGVPGITKEDLSELLGDQNIDISKFPKSFLKKVSREEIERFAQNIDSNRVLMLEEILEKTGLAQNQTVTLLTTFIVHSPTVPDFELGSYFKSFSSLMAFGMGKGLSKKVRKEPGQVGGKDIYRMLPFDEREEKFRKAEDVFEGIFQARPTAEDARDVASFMGLVKIINKYLSPEKKNSAYDGLMWFFYESTNYLSAHDILDDLCPKYKILKYFEENVEVSTARKFLKKEEIINNWIKISAERKPDSIPPGGVTYQDIARMCS